MNKEPKIWQVVSSLLPIFIGIIGFQWNLNTKVQQQAIKIEYLERGQSEMKLDIKEIKDNTQQIRILIENKKNRDDLQK